MKKIMVSIIALLLLSQGVLAQNTAETPAETEMLKAIIDCGAKSVEYSDAITKINLEKPYKARSDINFRVAFEQARNDYHAFMQCVFENVVEDMMGSSGANTDGIFGANAPNLPEWSKPESACLDEAELTSKLKNGSPEALVKPLLGYYNEYVDYLQLLFKLASEKVVSEGAREPIRFETLFSQNQVFRLLVENEIQDALAALDNAFIGLKEMRQAFMMHVHFQCMLKNLEFYRRALETLRRVVSALPDVIENASMHK